MTHTTTDDLHQRYAGHAPAWTPHLEHPVLQSLLRHRSVRRFLSTPLAPGVLDALVAAAQSAPTSSNLQTWSVVVVQEQALRDSLAALAGHQAHIAQAPAQVVHFDRYRVPDDEQEQIADYDDALRAFQRANGLPEVGWTPAVLQRLKNGQSLNGREHLREAVQAAGFELR